MSRVSSDRCFVENILFKLSSICVSSNKTVRKNNHLFLISFIQIISNVHASGFRELPTNISNFKVFGTFLQSFSPCTLHKIQSAIQHISTRHQYDYRGNEKLVIIQSSRVYPNISHDFKQFWMLYDFEQGTFSSCFRDIFPSKHLFVCIVDLLVTVLHDTKLVSTNNLELLLVQNSHYQKYLQTCQPNFIILPFSYNAKSGVTLSLPVSLHTRSTIPLLDIESIGLYTPDIFCSNEWLTFTSAQRQLKISRMKIYKLRGKVNEFRSYKSMQINIKSTSCLNS